AESPFALIRQIMQEDPSDGAQLNSEVDAESKRIVWNMIARVPNARYQNSHELSTDLEEYLAAHTARNITASLASKSVATAGAESMPTLLVDSPQATVAQPVTQPAAPQFVQPVTVPPPAAPQKSSSFALVAAIALIAFLAAAAAAGVIGYKMWRGHSFFSTNAEKASVLPVTTKTAESKPIAVQGESALNSAIAEVLTSELSSAGLEVANADDLPATEGIVRSASSGALLDRLRGHAGILVVARIEPKGERELNYMGRHDTAYSSRVSVTAYDVATGRPIGTRASASIEYTSLNAAKKAEEI